MSDYYPDELYYPALQPLQEPQYVFSQDRSISPPMSSPLVPAQAPSPPPTTDHQSGQYPIVQQAHHQGDSMRNAVFINVEGYVNYNFGRESHRAPSPSDRREASSPKPEQDFWTGRRQSHRPSSVQSYGSSRNSSLHGSPVMDPSYQSPVFSTEDQRNGSPGAGNSPRGLFPAPIDWTATQSRDQVSQGFTFNCEICGELVKASRRFDWQKHVMNDLRPYTCTAEDCSQPDETYSTLKDYLRHEIPSHDLPYSVDPINGSAKIAGKSITCLFCGQKTTEGRGQHSRGRHVGQHMEEIAFMVVPKAYEDWEFYSEASSGIQTDKDTHRFFTQYPLSDHKCDCQVHSCEKINPSTGKPCNTIFSRAYDITRHEDTIHNSRRQKIRCQICTEEKTFSRRDALTRHMRVVHPNVDFPTKKTS